MGFVITSALFFFLSLVSLSSLSNDWGMVYCLWAWCLIKYTKAYCSSHQLAFHSSLIGMRFWLIISWVLHSCSILANSFPTLLCSHVFYCENALDWVSPFEKTFAAPNLEYDCHSNLFGLKIRVWLAWSLVFIWAQFLDLSRECCFAHGVSWSLCSEVMTAMVGH